MEKQIKVYETEITVNGLPIGTVQPMFAAIHRMLGNPDISQSLPQASINITYDYLNAEQIDMIKSWIHDGFLDGDVKAKERVISQE